MVKCDICKNKVEETFLGKIKGTYIEVGGKMKIVCQVCQREYKDLKEKLS